MERDEIKKLIQQVLDKGYLMSLGTADEGGVWVADVIYVHDEDLNLYWISDPASRHSKAIGLQSKIAAAITAEHAPDNELGLQISGKAEKMEGPLFELEKKHRAKRNKPAPATPGEILEGESWYVLRPQKIELIHNQLFGYEKQVLEIDY